MSEWNLVTEAEASWKILNQNLQVVSEQIKNDLEGMLQSAYDAGYDAGVRDGEGGDDEFGS